MYILIIKIPFSLNWKECDCDDAWCNRCTVAFELNARCTDTKTLRVTSKDLMPIGDHKVIPVSIPSDIETVDPGILVVKLQKKSRTCFESNSKKRIWKRACEVDTIVCCLL